ncbi:MAG: GGDEF domain-containing response regulator [Phycisphaeraceae bacterium]|nr:GGDEF domain-containing response regulator [Phycisphaeraceae bacterium]
MSGFVPHLLVVEDDPDTADLICETLADHFGSPCTRRTASLGEARQQNPQDFDLVLTDMNLPDGTGLDVLHHVLGQCPDKPVVLVTGEGILENAIAAIRQGAYDYVVKAGDYLFAIPIVVEKNLELHRIKRQNAHLLEQLRHMAATDPLTGLANRRAFAKALDRHVAEALRRDHDLACLMIDLDRFKQLNDTFGHQQGDVILERMGRILEANCRQMDLAGRFGGDEFIVLLPDTDTEHAIQVARRISEKFEQMAANELPHSPVRLSLSIGVATMKSARCVSSEQLVRCADQALYRVKNHGRAGIHLFVPQEPAAEPGNL